MVLTKEIAADSLERGRAVHAEKRASSPVSLNGNIRFDSEGIDASWLIQYATVDDRILPIIGRKRSDLPSPSEYDMALASVLTKLGLEDQMIIKACIWAREQNGEDIKKCQRQDYWERTLGKARPVPVPKDEDAPDDWLCTWLNVAECRWIKYLSEPPVYAVIVRINEGDEPHEHRIDRFATLTKRASFYSFWADRTRRVLPDNPPGVSWGDILQRILDVLEELDMEGEGSDRGHVLDLLGLYLEGDPRGLRTGRNDDTIRDGEPFTDKGELWFRMEWLEIWVLARGRRLIQDKFKRGLKTFSGPGIAKPVAYGTSSERSSRSYYHVRVEEVRREDGKNGTPIEKLPT